MSEDIFRIHVAPIAVSSSYCVSTRRCTVRRAAKIFRWGGRDGREAVWNLYLILNTVLWEMDWNDLTEDRDRCRDLVNAVDESSGFIKCEKFLD